MSNIRVTIAPDSPRFLDQLRLHMRAHGLAYRTEQTYIHWAKRYIYYHGKRHPKDLGSDESFYNQIEVERDCCFS